MTVAMPESLAEGRFRLLEVIGEGGMATVYRAFDQRLQRPRAIKVLSPSLALRPALRKRFLAEAQTMANLEESRVVRIFDTGEEGETVYIVMELIEGGSLLDRVRDYGPLPPRMAAEATVQICESLQAAHDAGIIHRDIKPHNILLTRTGEIRVTDFGIAQVQSDDGNDGMTKTGAVMGTWGFMAPEQKSNAKGVDARADLYSVGATLWSLLTAATPPELFMADAEPGMLTGIPDELGEVIKRSTRYRREDRYLSARAMADSIRALVPMLPPDPELTVPLVPAALERRMKPMDTMQQFASEMSTGAEPGVQATMVPNLADSIDAAPAAPIADVSTFGADTPAAPVATPAAAVAPVPVPRASAARPSPLAAAETVLQAPPRSRTSSFLLVRLGVALIGLVAVGYYVVRSPQGDTPTPVPDAPVAVAPQALPTPAAPVEAPAPDAVAPSSAAPAPTPRASASPPAGTRAAQPGPTTPTEPATAAATAAPPPVDLPPAAAPAQAITHTPPGPARVGDSVPFAAGLSGSGWSVKLYYRPATGGAFQDKTMLAGGGGYVTTLKITDELAGGVAYFISATKAGTTLKEGSATSPRKVAVTP
jgi:serine/threonine protein kinase